MSGFAAGSGDNHDFQSNALLLFEDGIYINLCVCISKIGHYVAKPLLVVALNWRG